MATDSIKINLKRQNYRNERFKEKWMIFSGKVYCYKDSFRRLFNSKENDGFFMTSASEEVLDILLNDFKYNREKIILYYEKNFSFERISKRFKSVQNSRNICADKIVLIIRADDSKICIFISEYRKK